MSDDQIDRDARVQAILSDLLQAHVARSLHQMDESLVSWREGRAGVLEAHAEVLKHAARAERMATRVAQIDPEDLAGILRDAFDLGMLDRAEFIDFTGVEPDDVEPAGGLDDGLSTPLKRELVDDLIERGPILVHVNASVKGVSVPEGLRKDPKLVLRFGFHLSPPIEDFEVTEHAISGTLTFSGIPHHCILPWPSVYAVVSEADHRGMVWPEDVPRVVLEEMAENNDIPLSGPMPARRDSTTAEEIPDMPHDGSPSKKRRASHLKLVE